MQVTARVLSEVKVSATVCTVPIKTDIRQRGKSVEAVRNIHHASLDPSLRLGHFVTVNVTLGPGLRIQSGTPATLGYATGR